MRTPVRAVVADEDDRLADDDASQEAEGAAHDEENPSPDGGDDDGGGHDGGGHADAVADAQLAAANRLIETARQLFTCHFWPDEPEEPDPDPEEDPEEA